MKKSPVVLAPLPSSSVAWASTRVPWEPLARRRLEPGSQSGEPLLTTYRSQRPVTSSDSSRVCGRPCPQQSSVFRRQAGGPALSVPCPAIRVPRTGRPRRRWAACHRPSFGNPVLQRPHALNVPHVAPCRGPRGSRPAGAFTPSGLAPQGLFWKRGREGLSEEVSLGGELRWGRWSEGAWQAWARPCAGCNPCPRPAPSQGGAVGGGGSQSVLGEPAEQLRLLGLGTLFDHTPKFRFSFHP